MYSHYTISLLSTGILIPILSQIQNLIVIYILFLLNTTVIWSRKETWLKYEQWQQKADDECYGKYSQKLKP